MDQRKYEAARSEMVIAGSRAANMLRIFLDGGQIPSAHVSLIREIVEAHEAARAEWHASMGIPAEVARA